MNCRINRNTGQIGFDTAGVGSITDTFGKLKDAYARYAPQLKKVYKAATDKDETGEDAPADEMPPQELPPMMQPQPQPQPQPSGYGIGTLALIGLGVFLLLRATK